MNLLIVPNKFLVRKKNFKENFKKFFNFNFNLNFNLNFMINGELNYYGEISNINGFENTKYLGEIDDLYFINYKKYYKKNISYIENYPSNFNFDRLNQVNHFYINKKIKEFDAILFSYQAEKKNFYLLDLFKKNKKKVFIFDKSDDPEVYFNKEPNLYRDINKNSFDGYFKQDYPTNLNKKNTYPIAPIPCLLKNRKLNFKKNYTFSFIGYFEKNIIRQDRRDLCELLKKNFKDTKIILHYKNNLKRNKEDNLKKEEMDKMLNETLINLSPSGKVWCSYRHSELSNFTSPILMPKPYCKTSGDDFIDLKNCIQYDIKIENNDIILTNQSELVEKLKYLLDNPNLLTKIYSEYKMLIENNHTRKKKAEYILKIIYEKFNTNSIPSCN